MTFDQKSLREFRAVLDGALDLLETHRPAATVPLHLQNNPLPSLMVQCQNLAREIESRQPEPIRTLHNFACTGGTLLSKCLAVSPNTTLFSEIDPLSTLHLHRDSRRFFPTDLLADLHYSPRKVPQDCVISAFTASLKSLYDTLTKQGMRILLRDHTHSHFCTTQDYTARPTLATIASGVAPILSIVTVRHPIDSFLSLSLNKWVHFEPATLEEYCHRYMAFLEIYKDVPRWRYEDVVARPEESIAGMCAALSLPPAPDFEFLAPLFRTSGDSGRSGVRISRRPRRSIPEDLKSDMASSKTYKMLCRQLGYDP